MMAGAYVLGSVTGAALPPTAASYIALKNKGGFLEAFSAGTVAGAGARLLSGCAPGFEPPSELQRKSFDAETVIFNGKTISVNELGFEPMAYYGSIREKMARVISGDTTAAIRPPGYMGDAFPAGWELDPSRTAIIINQTVDGDFVSQAIIGRKKIGGQPLSGDGGFNDVINGIVSATAYDEHSLLVMGRGSKALWFDNVESQTDKGKARIVVDGTLGKIYQIVTNTPNLIESVFQKQDVAMNIGEINIKGGETNFIPTLTPMSEGFINFLKVFIDQLPKDLTKDQMLETIKQFFSGKGLSYSDKSQLKQLLSDNQYTQAIIDTLSRFNANIPFNNDELAFVNSSLADNIGKLLNSGVIGDLKQQIKGVVPTGDNLNINAINNIVSERIGLPMAAPEVYLLQVKNDKGALKWFMVGRYPVWENKVDRTSITADGYAINQGWFTYGEVSEEIVDNATLRPHEKIIDGFPFEQVKSGDANQNKPLIGGMFDGLYNLVEARQIGAEAIKYGLDPAESSPNHKINPGLFLSVDGEDRFLKLNLDNVWGSNIKDLPRLANRPLPLLGNSPRVIKDVTENVSDLITRGQTYCSPFLLDDNADFALVANMNEGPNGFLNFDFINESLTPEAVATLVSPGEFMKGGADNSILIFSKNKAGEQININVYDNKSGQLVNNIPVTHPVIVAPLEISEFIDGSGYIKIAGDENMTYLVREEDMFPLGARSSEKLTIIAGAEIAATIAAVYGGYQLVGEISSAGNFMTGIVGFLSKLFVH